MPALTTDSGTSAGNYLNDCYGSLTQTAGTEILRVVPPRDGAPGCVGNFRYEAAATAHTLTMMMVTSSTTVATDAASGQAVVNMSGTLTDASGGAVAASDFLVLQYESGVWEAHKVSSVSGLAITVTANLTAKIKAGSIAYCMGAPADHAARQFTMKASTTTDFIASDNRVQAARSVEGNPILVHSNNATNAGTLYWLSYYYD